MRSICSLIGVLLDMVSERGTCFRLIVMYGNEIFVELFGKNDFISP